MNSEILGACRALLLALACTCLLSLGGNTVSAQNAANGDAYKELIEQALSEFKHRNWPEARVLFMRAHDLNPNARTLRGMGVVSFEMRDYLNAVINLKAALDDGRQSLTEPQRKECEGLLSRARTYVGVYTLKLDPVDARVLLDGAEPTRDEAGRLLVPFGEHTLSGRAQGRQEAITRFTVQGGERGELSLILPRDVPAAHPPLLAAAAAPVATLPSDRAAISPAPGTTRRHDEEAFVGHGLKYTWVTLVASAAFGGAAVATWTLGNKELEDLDTECRLRADGESPCTPDNTDTDKLKLFETLTNASIGVSAAALVATAVLMGLEWPRERNLALGIGPTSLSLRGAF